MVMRTYNARIALAAVAVVGIAIIMPRTAPAATATADADATIIQAIGIVQTPPGLDLEFASIVPDTVAIGTLVVSPAGGKTCAANLVCIGAVAAASFNVTGATGATYAITLPGSAIITEGGGATMTVNGFTSNPTPTGTLTGGAETLTVGATLNVGISQAAGTYTGTFTVTVAYN